MIVTSDCSTGGGKPAVSWRPRSWLMSYTWPLPLYIREHKISVTPVVGHMFWGGAVTLVRDAASERRPAVGMGIEIRFCRDPVQKFSKP